MKNREQQKSWKWNTRTGYFPGCRKGAPWFVLLLAGLLIAAACESGPASTNKTASVTVTVGDSGISPQAFQGTFDKVESIIARAFNGETLLDTANLDNSLGPWRGTIYALPVGPTLTFTAQGFDQYNTKIFEGSLGTTVAEEGNQLMIPMGPVDDGTGFPTPAVTGIVMPALITASTEVSIDFSVSGQNDSSLDFAIYADGGVFSPQADTIELDGSGNGAVTVRYTAPALTGTLTHYIELINPQSVTVGTVFGTVVVPPRCVLGVSKLDECTLGP